MREIFKFLASLKLALILLAVIIIAVAFGTYYESAYNADIAKRIVYNHWWFDLWLMLLCVNLFCVAAIRYPWKPHQTGFVITHAGIIVLLIGGLIDRQFGVEGSVGLNRGDAPTNIMELRDQELIVFVEGTLQPSRTTLKVNALTYPSDLKFPLATPSPDVKVEVLDIKPIESVPEVVPTENGVPAIHLALEGQMMGKRDYWILLDDSVNLGPAALKFEKAKPKSSGGTTDASGNKMVPRTERHHVFAKFDPMVTTMAGEPTKLVSKLVVDAKGEKPELQLKLMDKDFTFAVLDNLEKEIALDGLPEWRLFIYGYYPNFRMAEGGKLVTVDNNPENPAIVFEVMGPLVPAPKESEKPKTPHAGAAMAGHALSTDGLALTIYLEEDKTFTFGVKARTGSAEIGKTIEIGDFAPGAKFTILEAVPSAAMSRGWRPKLDAKGVVGTQFANANPGALCRVTANNQTKDVWVPQTKPLDVIAEYRNEQGKPIDVEMFKQTVEVGNKKVQLAFGNRTVRMPFTIALKRFHAPFQEGLENSTNFMSFESTLSFENQNDTVLLKSTSPYVGNRHADPRDGRILAGAIVEMNEKELKLEFDDRHSLTLPMSDVQSFDRRTHKIYMNNPTTYPITWYGPWLGTGYKFSQAGHDMPNNPNYSGVQILRDPGWMPKWVGSLMICFGIFTMFYLKPYFSGRRTVKEQEKKLALQGKVTGSEKNAELAAAGKKNA